MADRAAKLAAQAPHPYLAPVSEPTIFLTDSAAKRVATIAARQARPAILRLAVDGGGCAGFTYKVELAEAAEADDTASGGVAGRRPDQPRPGARLRRRLRRGSWRSGI